MSKKRENFLEQHFDKIILAGIGLISIGLLWLFIFRNPFGPVIDGRRESPGSAQTKLVQKAERLREKIESPSDAVAMPQPDFIPSFERLLSSSIPSLNPQIYPMLPGIGRQPIETDREYAVPEIPPLQDIQMAYIRAAAYVPTEEITPEMPYDNVPTQIGDVDFVTVSARLDVRRIVQQFQSAFMGLGVRPAHRDPVLAVPVAARVELQRREQLPDGTWGPWVRVPVPQTIAYKKLFDQLPDRTEDLSGGGVSVQMEQFKERIRQSSLLQQRAYDFATSRYQYWMPPPFLEEAQKLLQQQRDEARRAAQQAAGAGAAAAGRVGAGGGETPFPGAGGPRPTQPGRQPRPARPEQPTRGREPVRPGAGEMMPETAAPTGPGGAVRPGTRQRTIEDVWRDFQKELLTDDWWKRTEPLLIWAHDDTVQPGKTYQYRIRVGMFNPIAGKDWFKAEQQEFKNQVVLWTPFAETIAKKNEPLIASIPKTLHIFPMDISKTNPIAVNVRVSKYYMGRWRSQDFEVLPGQTIGSVVEVKKTTTSPAEAGAGLGMEGMAPPPPMMGGGMPMPAEGAGMMGTAVGPEKIDFTTPYLYLDQISEVDWSGTMTALRRREFVSILYAKEDGVLEKLPIRQPNWSAELRKNYRDVQEAEREAENEVFVGRTPQPGLSPTPGGFTPGGFTPGGFAPGGFPTPMPPGGVRGEG
ncbi:MAG TPA: hypothetical protein PK054_06865 [Anaerohalosphaeraceae bacterium]|nr:hypothetical protein [Anaerohalosphaeraceae bacterium]HOL89204.1 hypothetical protein [Anaerohalosphaeraceae bacterium]HPP56290.1 hypothetical protein [Anaerohalosphaeraceae bacterium]